MELVHYEKREVVLNVLTHAIGAIAFIVFAIVLYQKAENKGEVAAYLIYTIALFIMFFNSTFYHAVPRSKFQYVMRAIDHSSIFLAIAGTYTPILALGIKSNWKIPGLVLIWAFAIWGIVLKIVSFAKNEVGKSEKLSLGLYLGMGWMAILFMPLIYRDLGLYFIGVLLLGGLFYTGGVFFYRSKNIPLNHFIWHVFIMLGAFTHFYAVTLV